MSLLTRKISIEAITIGLFFMFGMMSSASALTIDANDLTPPWTLNTNYWTGLENNEPDILAAIAPIILSAQSMYKQNYGGTEEGPLAGAYHTIFIDASNGQIIWDGPSYISSPDFLLVKDGRHTPAWYLFNLGSVPWDGKQTIVLSNFWIGQGGISNVEIFGTAVPEPGILILLGIAMSAIGVASWRIRKL